MLSEEEQMKLELQRMQRRADEVTDESLESTRRMLAMSQETQDTGIKTLVALDEQGEKLNRVEETLYAIKDDMREAEKNLTGLEKFCGLCICSCKKDPKFEESEQYKKAYGRKNDESTKQYSSADGVARTKAPTGGYIQRVTNDAREDEMDENLGQVEGIVQNIKMMAIDMGAALIKQDDQINRIIHETSVNENRVQIANERTVKIIRK